VTSFPPSSAHAQRKKVRVNTTRFIDAGYSTIEAVLLIPCLVLFTLLLVQVALVWHARNVAEAAARQGVQAARLYGADPSEGRRQVHDYLDTVAPELLRGARIDLSRTPTTVSVRIRAQILPVAGIPLTFTIDERATGPLELFVGTQP
jgi:hypothetical protein